MEARLQHLEDAGKVFAEIQNKMDDKVDSIHKLLMQWAPNESGSAQRPHTRSSPSFTPPPPDQQTLLTSDELAFLKKQEAAGKISLLPESFLHIGTHRTQPSSSLLIPDTNLASGFVYTKQMPESTPLPKPPPNQQTSFTFPNHHQPPHTNQTQPPNPHHLDNINHHTNFNLSITRPKLDFPSFSGDGPMNWLRQCEKYFALANVPIDTWVPLATLYCHGSAQTWWRSLRTPANYVHWTQFCTMVTNRFSFHSTHASLENFHHLKQTTSVSEYIQKFEEMMALMQMDYPGLTKPYFVSSFIARLKEGIKHYLIPHRPQNV
jgi:hypothetical protein